MHSPFSRPWPRALWTCRFGLALAVILAAAGTSRAEAPSSDAPAHKAAPGPLVLDDVPEPLVPKSPRTEADRDRLEALTLFSAARLQENREHEAEALRLYERAFRHDPQSLAICRAIVPLAMRLGREAVALRYAMKAADLDNPDTPWLRTLGDYLAARGDWEKALVLYRRAIAARQGETPEADDALLWMAAGRVSLLVKEPHEAADYFARVVQALNNPKPFGLDDPKTSKELLQEPADTWAIMGEAFLLADRFPEAVAAFQKAQAAAPNEGLLAYRLARVLARQDKPGEALAKLQVYFDKHLDTEGVSPYALLAELLGKQKRQEELVPSLEKLRESDPENAPLGYFLAEQYAGSNRVEKAEALYRELLKKSPTVIGYRSLVDICRKTDRPDALLDVLAELVDKTGGLEALGLDEAGMFSDAALVDRLLEAARNRAKAQGQQPPYPVSLTAALVALRAKRFDRVAEFLDPAVQSKPDRKAEMLLFWALALMDAERYAEAAAVFQRGVQENVLPEENPVFGYYLASALEMAGRTDDALAAARQALDRLLSAVRKAEEDKSPKGQEKADELRTTTARYRGRIAWVLYHGKRYDQARQAYQELIEQFDANYASSELRQVLRESRLVLSNLCVLRGDMPQAVEWLEQVLDEFPDDISALNDLGYLWADEKKNLHRAERMIRQALEGDPENPAYRDSLGWVLYRLGRFPEAVIELEKAAAKEPDPVVLDHLGDAYWAAKEPDKARQFWQKAIDAHQKAGEKEKAEKVSKKLKEHVGKDEG